MEQRRRDLTDTELFVLREVQAYWGDQNTVDDVFFSDRDEAVLFVKAREGTIPVCVVLTNLGAWHRDGSLSLEELRRQVKGPDADPGLATVRTPARQFYLGLAWLSLPGTWWLAFEMYVLTFVHGPGMILFGVLHSWPLFGLAIALSVWLLPLWLVLTMAALILSTYRQKLAVSRSVLVRVAAAIGLQLALMVSYEWWSQLPNLRGVMCLVGLATVVTLTVSAFGSLRRSAAELTARASG